MEEEGSGKKREEDYISISQPPRSSCTFLAIDHSLVLLLLNISCHGNRLYHKAKERVVWGVWKERPKLPKVLWRCDGVIV